MNKEKGSKQSGKALAATSREIMGETRPSREAYYQQLQSAINTGGSGGRIPILNAAISGSEYGKSRAMADTQDYVAKSGVGGDFGRGIAQNVDTMGGRATGGTRQAIIAQMLGQAPNAALTAAQQGTGALAKSAQTNAQLTSAANAAQGQAIGAGAAGLGAIAGAVIIAV